MKYRKKIILCFSLVFIFCMVYHFFVVGKNSDNTFYEMIDFNNNAQGYLSYFNTSTFYTLTFAFLLAGSILKINNQHLVRISRTKCATKNLKHCLFYSLIFSFVFCIPHLIFMTVYFSYAELVNINFFYIFAMQFLAYILYYILTSQIMMFFYYLTLKCILSCVFTFAINAMVMFLFRLLKINTPIKSILVCTKYYLGNYSASRIFIDMLLLVPMILILIIININILKNKEVL